MSSSAFNPQTWQCMLTTVDRHAIKTWLALGHVLCACRQPHEVLGADQHADRDPDALWKHESI